MMPTKLEIAYKVLEALKRVLDPTGDPYHGLKLSGDREAAQLFHNDVMLIAETLADIVLQNDRPKVN